MLLGAGLTGLGIAFTVYAGAEMFGNTQFELVEIDGVVEKVPSGTDMNIGLVFIVSLLSSFVGIAMIVTAVLAKHASNTAK